MFYSILDWLSAHIVGLGWTESQSSSTVQKLRIQHQWLVLDTNLLHSRTLAIPQSNACSQNHTAGKWKNITHMTTIHLSYLPVVHVQEKGACSRIQLVSQQFLKLIYQNFPILGSHRQELLHQLAIYIIINIHFHLICWLCLMLSRLAKTHHHGYDIQSLAMSTK